MFAILYSKNMDPFYNIFLSFPTVIFSLLIVLCILFCLVAVLGVVDFDILNFDLPEADNLNVDNLTNAHVLASLMMKLGLVGIPAPIILFSMSLIGWLASFILCYYTFKIFPEGILRFVCGVVILFSVSFFSAYITGLILRPFKKFFETANQEVQKEIIGHLGVVRTSKVNDKFGEATVEDGGAGLIVKVRSYKHEEFSRGDRIILLDYLPQENVYRVISEKDFNK